MSVAKMTFNFILGWCPHLLLGDRGTKIIEKLWIQRNSSLAVAKLLCFYIWYYKIMLETGISEL